MKELISTISKKEWIFVAIMSVVMILVTGLPFLYASMVAPDGYVYNGIHALSPGDIPVYYSNISQVKEGNFLPIDLFTSEPQTVGTFNVWWSLVGLAARIFNLSTILAFQLSRLLMIPVFVAMAYIFLSYFFSEKIKRKIALIFLLFSGGIGFYFAGAVFSLNIADSNFYAWPIDLWLTEATTFNALYQTSHFIASITLMMLIFLLMIFAFAKKRFSYAVISGLLCLFYFNFHPYYLPVIFGVLGLYLFILMIQANRFLWVQAGYLITAFLISLPSPLYHFWLILQSPVIHQRALQNITEISPPIFVLLGYGFLIPGFLLGVYFLLRNKRFNNKHGFLLIWLVVDVALIYSDFPFHSRYTQGIQVILAIFTVIGLFSFWQYLKTKYGGKLFEFWVNNPVLWVILFVLLFCSASLYSLTRDFYQFTYKPGRVATDMYLPKGTYEAMDYLSQQPRPQVVLASALLSNFVPSFSGHQVYAVHGHETLFFYSKEVFLDNFFKTQSDEIRQKFLARENIDYFLYSIYEQQLSNFDPADKEYFELVFSSPQAKVYKVISN